MNFRFALLAALATLSTQSLAAEPPSPLASLFACADIAEEGARLACFDARVAELKSQESAGALRTLDLETLQKLEAEAFGFPTPSFDRLLAAPVKKAEEPPAAATLETTVSSFRATGDGKGLVVFANGQQWRLIESLGGRVIRSGKAVRVRRAALGSYLMIVDGVSFRVRREQ